MCPGLTEASNLHAFVFSHQLCVLHVQTAGREGHEPRQSMEPSCWSLGPSARVREWLCQPHPCSARDRISLPVLSFTVATLRAGEVPVSGAPQWWGSTAWDAVDPNPDLHLQTTSPGEPGRSGREAVGRGQPLSSRALTEGAKASLRLWMPHGTPGPWARITEGTWDLYGSPSPASRPTSRHGRPQR